MVYQILAVVFSAVVLAGLFIALKKYTDVDILSSAKTITYYAFLLGSTAAILGIWVTGFLSIFDFAFYVPNSIELAEHIARYILFLTVPALFFSTIVGIWVYYRGKPSREAVWLFDKRNLRAGAKQFTREEYDELSVRHENRYIDQEIDLSKTDLPVVQTPEFGEVRAADYYNEEEHELVILPTAVSEKEMAEEEGVDVFWPSVDEGARERMLDLVSEDKYAAERLLNQKQEMIISELHQMVLREYDVNVDIDDLDDVIETTLYEDLSSGEFEENYIDEPEEDNRLERVREKGSEVLDLDKDE